jgi:PHP family Zn ribbon phosphoesterase
MKAKEFIMNYDKISSDDIHATYFHANIMFQFAEDYHIAQMQFENTEKVNRVEVITQNKVMRKSKWYKIMTCSKCKYRLTHNEKMHSGGVCPYCGLDDASTMCDTVNVIARKIKHHKWWEIRKRKITYEIKE